MQLYMACGESCCGTTAFDYVNHGLYQRDWGCPTPGDALHRGMPYLVFEMCCGTTTFECVNYGLYQRDSKGMPYHGVYPMGVCEIVSVTALN